MAHEKLIQHHLVTTPNAGEDVEKSDYSYISGGNCYFHSHFGRQIAWQYNQKLNICIYSIPFLSLCPTEVYIFTKRSVYKCS